jgi:pimeloyl-ACP methyl ester carboxylesterase
LNKRGSKTGKANCNGVKINYRCVGEGRDVVLIHGLGANHAFWHINIMLPLAREYRVTVYDLRGHGYSEMPSSGYTSNDMAEDLFDLMKNLSITKAHLIGHSFGGGVALSFAARYPDLVDSLIIADSRIKALQPFQRLTDWPDWERVKKKLEENDIFIPDDETEIGLFLLEQLAYLSLKNKKQMSKCSPKFIPFSGWGGGNRSAERWIELLNTTSARLDFTALPSVTADDILNITHPVLALYGEKSLVLQSYYGLQKLLQNYRAITVPNVGHFFPVQRPKFFVDRVIEFLKEVDSGIQYSEYCDSNNYFRSSIVKD